MLENHTILHFMRRQHRYIFLAIAGLTAFVFFMMLNYGKAHDHNLKAMSTTALVSILKKDNTGVTQELISRAESGDSVAQFAVAPLYYAGIYGLELNKKKGRDLWQKSCSQGVEASCTNYKNTAD